MNDHLDESETIERQRASIKFAESPFLTRQAFSPISKALNPIVPRRNGREAFLGAADAAASDGTMPAPSPHPMDGMGFGVEHLLDMSPGATGAPNAPPPGSLATPGAVVVTDLLLNGHPSGLPLGTFAAVALPLAPEPPVRAGVVPRAGRGGRMRACPHPGCGYATDQGAARLATHARTHLDDRPFVCAEPGCAKRFKTKEHLRQHKNAHVTSRSFACDRALCVRTNHAPFKSAAEVALHARRVHTLDAAERREVKHLEKITRLERALADARRDGETLRRAADVLKESLEETTRAKKTLAAASRRRKRKSDGKSVDDDVCRDSDARDDDGATTGTPTRTSTGTLTTKQKEKKPYTLSASNVLRVAERAAAAARRAVAEREETGDTPPRRRRKG